VKQNLFVKLDGTVHRFQMEKVFESDRLEKYKVYGGNKEIVLQTNRKLFLAKGFKHRKGEWTVIEGTLTNHYALEAITQAIEALK